MRNDGDDKGAGTGDLKTGEPEPTGRATPVDAGSSVRVTAKARTASAKSKAAKSKAGETPLAPRSRRAPVNASPSEKKSATTAAKKSAPPSRPRRSRVPPRPEASIPPTWSDVGERGEPVAAAEVSPILPAPMPTFVGVPEVRVQDAASDVLPPPVRSSRLSPYARAATGVVAVVALVFVARGFAHRAPRPVPPSNVVAAAAVGSAPAEAPPEAMPGAMPTPVAETPESAEGLKHASLEALEQRKLDDSVAAGERATQLDPTDADAWLILGAAYHDQGNVLAARRSYAACAKQATRGEVRECKFLLQ